LNENSIVCISDPDCQEINVIIDMLQGDREELKKQEDLTILHIKQSAEKSGKKG